jgi:hypothetical protein
MIFASHPSPASAVLLVSSKEKVNVGGAHVKGPGFKSQYVHEREEKIWRFEVVHIFFPSVFLFFFWFLENFNFSCGIL